MIKIPSTVFRKSGLLILLLLFSVSVFAVSPETNILYVGAISINPCQDAKILAEWYSRLGIETKDYQGEYFAKIETAAGTFAFAIHPKKADAPTRSSASVAIVFRVKNFDECLSSLKAKGLSPESTEKDQFGQYAHFHDPDGNEVTLWARP
jgi:predicted enzyme related to lactoylglutathione lyase